MSPNFWCNLFGHKWRYKDFANAINADGKKVNYSATRRCRRCDKLEYKFAEWVPEERVPEQEKYSFPGNK